MLHLRIILYTFLTAMFIRFFFVEAYNVPTKSMAETILEGDYLVVNKFIYGISTPRYLPFTDIEILHFKFPAFLTPKRGDIVVFHFPGNSDEVKSKEPISFVKRCVGIAGDTIKVADNKLYVNNREFPSNGSIDGDIYSTDTPSEKNNFGPVIVPKKGEKILVDISNVDQWRVFIEREGHDVNVGDDGSILVDGIKIKSYTVEKNYYFMMGDNRNDSYDSRHWGFLSEDNIIGKALFVYWSWDQQLPSGSFIDKAKSIKWTRIGTLLH